MLRTEQNQPAKHIRIIRTSPFLSWIRSKTIWTNASE